MKLDRRFFFTGLLSLLLAASLAMPANAQLSLGKLGVSAGGNLTSMDDLNTSTTSATFDNSLGFHFGASYEQPLGSSGTLSAISVRTGIFGRRVGTYTMASDLDNPSDADFLLEGRDFTIWTIEFPLEGKYSFDQYDFNVGGSSATPYALLGPQLSILRGEEDFQEALNDVMVSVNLGAGVEYGLPLNLTLMPELRYEFGATDVFEDDASLRFRDLNVNDSPSVGSLHFRIHLFYQLP